MSWGFDNSFPELNWEKNIDSQSKNSEEETKSIHENSVNVMHVEICKDEVFLSLTKAMEKVRNKV